MIPEIGLLFLILAFTISSFYVFSNSFSFYRNNNFIISPRIVYLFFFSVLLSFICLEVSFLTDDFSVLYVANNSNENLPDYYKFAALWGGHEGSMLLYLYHNQDSPEISDQEYDQLFKKLLVFESEFPEIKEINSPSERVGSVPVSELRSFNHQIPMLSLDNAFDDQDIEDFEKRFLNKLKRKEVFSYSCEPKIDGIAICLVYQNGILTRAGTRGDGNIGEEVKYQCYRR